MLAITGAQLGISTRCVISDIEPTPRAMPKTAIPIGRPIATTDPNPSSRMTIATTRPSTSPSPRLGLLEGVEEFPAQLDPQR